MLPVNLIKLDQATLFLARNRPVNEFNHIFPREIFQMLAINLCKGHEDQSWQLSILSQVSWQWHQNSLHIDTVIALLNSGALNLEKAPLLNRPRKLWEPLHCKLLCCFIEVLYGKRSIEGFRNIQEQSYFLLDNDWTKMPISKASQNSKLKKDPNDFYNNCSDESSEEDELFPQMSKRLKLNSEISDNLTRIKKSLIPNFGALRYLKNLPAEIWTDLLTKITQIEFCGMNFPSYEILQLTNLVTLSVCTKWNLTFKLNPLSQLRNLNISLLDQGQENLPAILPKNFPVLQSLYIKANDDRKFFNTSLDKDSIAPPSLTSIHFVYIKPSLSFFNLAKNLIHLKMEGTRDLQSEHFFSEFPSLKELFISFYGSVRMINHFNFNMPQLENLHLEVPERAHGGFKKFSLNSIALKILHLNCPNLKEAKFENGKLHSIKVLAPKELKEFLMERLPKSAFI